MMIYLASQSPRRVELLQQIGVSFQQLSCAIDETPLPDELPDQYVLRMAREKAKAGWAKVMGTNMKQHPLLAADTTVVFRHQILGKPASEYDARRMLRLLSGQTHQVMTAIAVCDGSRLLGEVVSTEVTFTKLSGRLISDYIASGESRDKAGAYGIQGYGAVLVSDISGSYSAVVGLPLMETARLLNAFDIPMWGK